MKKEDYRDWLRNIEICAKVIVWATNTATQDEYSDDGFLYVPVLGFASFPESERSLELLCEYVEKQEKKREIRSITFASDKEKQIFRVGCKTAA